MGRSAWAFSNRGIPLCHNAAKGTVLVCFRVRRGPRLMRDEMGRDDEGEGWRTEGGGEGIG